jgi:thioredoxin reductase/ferredoxin
MSFDPLLAVYAVPLLAVWFLFYRSRRKAEQRHLAVRETARASGLTEPASLHPLIDPALCMGCGACVSACPEGEIIGLIHGKAELIEPTHCIGHGACAAACPFDAISLVFGTETRGVEIPHVDPDFQTNVPGIYIAGELGGMGLIRNAIEQGRQAVQAIAVAAKRLPRRAGVLDVVIVGAGPAGLAATLGAKAQGLTSATIEQDSLGGTVAHFPRGKLVMTRPAELPIVGKVNFRETTKEALLGFWEDVVRKTGIKVSFHERVDKVTPMPDGGFEVTTTRQAYRTNAVLLTIGRRGTPRRLDVPGEDQSKVVYRLIDPEQYKGHKVAVIGGGDSAVEAAVSIAEEPGTTVTLSYRGEAFNRLKPKNREKMEGLVAARRIKLLLNSVVKEIAQSSIVIQQGGRQLAIENDAVIVCAGGILPTGFLRAIGIEVETKHGTA